MQLRLELGAPAGKLTYLVLVDLMRNLMAAELAWPRLKVSGAGELRPLRKHNMWNLFFVPCPSAHINGIT